MNTAGSFKCKCVKGFKSKIPDDGHLPDGCEDIDECNNNRLNNCHKNAQEALYRFCFVRLVES